QSGSGIIDVAEQVRERDVVELTIGEREPLGVRLDEPDPAAQRRISGGHLPRTREHLATLVHPDNLTSAGTDQRPRAHSGAAGDTPDLTRWLPDPILRSVHRREADAPPAALWSAAGTVTLADCRVLGRLVRWRIPGLAADLPYRQLFRAEPFVLLEETGCSSVS